MKIFFLLIFLFFSTDCYALLLNCPGTSTSQGICETSNCTSEASCKSLVESTGNTTVCRKDTGWDFAVSFIYTGCTTPPPPLCTDYVYTEWSACTSGNQTRSVISGLPSGCSGTGSSPVISRSCTPPPPPPPEHCSNGIADLDMDETGTDCGPACGNQCIAKCADGDELVFGLFDGYYQQMCYRLAPQDSQGKCPTLYSPMNSECKFTYPPAGAKSETPPDPETLSTPPPVQTLGQTYAESGSSSSSTSSDGSTSSSSSTGSISGSGASGGSVTSTVTRTTTTDPVTGEQTTEETEEVTVSPPTKYEQTFDAAAGDQSRFTTRFSEFTSNVRNAPFYSSFAEIFNPPTQGGISTHTLTMGAYGQESINLADYESVWSAIKLILTFGAMFVAARLIMANK